MAGQTGVKDLVKRLSKLGILISADVDAKILEGIDVDDLASRIIERRSQDATLSIVNNAEIESIISELQMEKAPTPIEIIQKPEYRSEASDIDADYKISNREIEYSNGTVDGFVSHFRSRLERLRMIIEQHRSSVTGLIADLDGLKSFSSGREITVIGIIMNKITTKNGNIMVVIDDQTGDAKIMFMNGTNQKAKDLFEKARHLVNDEVIAIKGKISGPFVIANEIIWPDVPIQQRKEVEEDITMAFISDMHVGSKFFMEKHFANFIKWTNGDYDEQPISQKDSSIS
jgi:DNA polymerase II small subunit